MSSGDLFTIKCTWNGKNILVNGICSSFLVNTYDWNNNNLIQNRGRTLLQAQEDVDDFLGTNFWQATKLPYYIETDTEQIRSLVTSIFPGWFEYIDNPPAGDSVDFNDNIIPGGFLYQKRVFEESGTLFCPSGGSLSNLTFPYIFTYCRGASGRDYTRLYTNFIVAPDNFIVNGEISDVSNVKICRICFDTQDGKQFTLTLVGSTSSTLIDSDFWTGKSIIIFDDDPFQPGGDSGTGGGGGNFDNTSVPIDIPNLPSISAASTGFISLFNPSLSQLNELSSYLWSDLFEIDGWKKLFADPMDAILGLSILPVPIPSGGVREVKVGNIGTGISLTIAASQFVEVDCGSINVNEYWGAYLDYEPYTQAQIFLPYIGTRPISVDEIMGKTVRVVYHVDILTGACCCFVKCGESVLYTYNGQCSIPIPITGANYTSVVNGVISVAASVGSLVATGGASAPIAVPAIASSAVNQMKPQIEKSGSISGSAGVLNMQIPYLILIRPRQALPSKQNEFIGYPSLITVQLTELTGYTEVQSIHLENIPATQEELAEIQSLLEGGVIF